MTNALTVDVEDYYQVSAFDTVVRFEDWGRYESRVVPSTYRILDILDDKGAKGTFFVLGWIAQNNPELVKNIQKRGHEIACHGYSHRRVYTQTPEQFRAETRMSKRILEDITGHEVIGYRAASYSITPKSMWALDILTEEGFKYDSSIFPIRHDIYGIPGYPRFMHKLKGNGSPMIEMPLSTVRFLGTNFPVGGGGYLRLYPYLFTSLAIRRINNVEGAPAIVYLHPWEIDPDQPRIEAPLISHFRHYTNLGGMEKKLIKLLAGFSFAPLREIMASQGSMLP